jgi:hypothetical protein
VFAFLLAASGLPVPEPTVRDVTVRGLRINGTTTLTITGDNLDRGPKLLLPFAAKQTLKPGSTDKQAVFEVTLPPDAPPGLHQLRVVTRGGVSTPVVIGVDALEQKPFAPKVAALPVALHGALNGSTVLETTFSGKAGQALVVDVEAQRLGGKLRPVVHLSSAKKLQLEWAWGTPALHGDARLTATLPADGEYTVALHDAEYATPGPGTFRMKIGTFDFAEQVFPPVATRETKSVEVLGPTVAKVELPAVRTAVTPLDWPKGGLWTGPRPFVELSKRPEFIKPDGPEKIMELPLGSVGVSGKLGAGEEDKFRVPVQPGSRVRFEVFAERIGSPLDAALVLRNDAGAVLAQAEDSPGTLDPVLEYTVPDKVTSVIVGVIDSQGRGGPRGIYRLTIDPVRNDGRGEFHLNTPLQRLSLSTGGRSVVPVFVERRGFNGKIALAADKLPAGLKLDGLTIPADADGTLITVTTTSTVPAGVLNLKGRGGLNEHPVTFKGHPLERIQPWLAAEFAVAPTSTKVADFTVDWNKFAADTKLVPGGKLALPVKLARIDALAPVRLTLLTSQAPPLVNGQPNPGAAIRLERPVELGAKVLEGEVPVVLPPDLPADAYQVAVLAELLSPDRQRVIASAVTPVRKLFVALPLVVKLDDTRFDAPLDAKTNTVVDVSGVIERQNGFAGDVVVAITGVPPGVPVPGPLTVKGSETDFAFKLTVPPNIAAGETKLKITASAIDPKQPNVRVKGRDVEVILNVIPPPK